MSTTSSSRPPIAAPDSPKASSDTARPEPRVGREKPKHRRGLLLGVRVVLAGLIALVIVFEVNVATDPGVSSAPALVVAIDRTHATSPATIDAEEHIAQALVASEDGTFYSNDGLDAGALARAFWGFLTGQDLGGSTIEVQLAHVLYPAVTEGFWGRVRRVSLALEFDTHFTKTAILSMYLSAVYFGHGYYGIRAASLGYFGVEPAQLTWAQGAMLAGLVQAPSALDPFRHLSAAEARMRYVLQRLVSFGQLTPTQATGFEDTPVGLVNRPSPRA
jgi:membrane peptidoglycan carboxypeptidase